MLVRGPFVGTVGGVTDSERIADLEQQVERLSALVESIRRPKLWVPPYATIGEGADVDPAVTLWCSEQYPIRIGERTRVYRGAEWNGPITIGDRCMVNRDSYIRQNTTIGDDVYIGPFVRLITDGHEVGSGRRRAGANTSRPIVVGAGTWIGASVTVVGGVTIGAGCVIAAGSVVTRDVPDNTLVGGVPAVPLKTLEAEESPTPAAVPVSG